MKILKKGTNWTAKMSCTGKGNGDGGCGAELEVERDDLFLTHSHARDETTTYVTVKCPQCKTLTDLGSQYNNYGDLPSRIRMGLPDQKAWEEKVRLAGAHKE